MATPLLGHAVEKATATTTRGVVWTQQYPAPEPQALFDVIHNPWDNKYLFAGYTDDEGSKRTLLMGTDHQGRAVTRHVGSNLGSQGYNLTRRGSEVLLGGVDDQTPLLVKLSAIDEIAWRRTYGGTVFGTVLIASRNDSTALG